MRLPKIQVGDAITAEFLNALVDAARRADLTIGPSSNLVMVQGNEGSVLSAVVPQPIFAKTTGAISGGKYPWTQQFPATSGGWTAGARTGTAYESNGNLTVPTNTHIVLEYTPEGDWRFQSDSC